jgi:hypothetical protein
VIELYRCWLADFATRALQERKLDQFDIITWALMRTTIKRLKPQP